MSGEAAAGDADFIVVGAGSSGCVLANRLSADPGQKVVLLEAGGEGGDLLVRIPLAWMQVAAADRFTWGYSTEPEPFLDQRVQPLPRGKMLGGSSAINGMMYIRGGAADYNEWRDQGLSGWSYAEVLPYFKRAETNWRGETMDHGGAGPLRVTPIPRNPAVFPPLLRSAQALGYAESDDFNVAYPEGFGLPDFTVGNGRRHSTARAYLDPVRGRPNLDIRTGALVTRIVIEDGRAVGVEYRRGGQVVRLRARKEVILSGGAFNSPHLLMLSGVGPADHLREHGIAPLVDLPGVGGNLQEHPIALSFWQAARPVTFDSSMRLDRLAAAAIRWQLTGKGPFSGSPMSIQGFYRSSAKETRPDIQLQISHTSFAARPWFPGWRKGAGHQFSVVSLLLSPDSRGTVRLKSNDPAQLPAVTLNMLQAESDRAAMREMLRFQRRLMTTEAASAIVGPELAPGPAMQSDDELDAWLRATAISGAHPTSTCAMGQGDHAVVDAELKVRGVRGLRVVDASVLPNIIRGNTNAPAIMIAEKASDMALGRSALPAEFGAE